MLLAAGAGALELPAAPNGRISEYEASSRLFGRAGVFEPLADWTQRWQYADLRPFRALTLGSYARVERHFKLGLFYRLQYGARHNDDWLRDGQGLWFWRDAARRLEHVLILDATPRAQLGFLPGGAWVGSIKARFEHNFFNGQDILSLEPELAWFWMNGLEPRATIFLRQQTEFALNFGERNVWQRWWYLAALWHAAPSISMGPSIALRDEVWSTSSSFKSFSGTGAGYQTLFRAWVLGFTLVARLR